jgi:hypothetical protein
MLFALASSIVSSVSVLAQGTPVAPATAPRPNIVYIPD